MDSRIKELMHVAYSYSSGSLDPFKKVGCVLLDEQETVVGLGFNHLAKEEPRSAYQDREARRPFMIHAEIDALSSFHKRLEAPVIAIVTLLPCTYCMTVLAAFKIRKVYFHEAYEKDLKSLEVANRHGILTEQVTL
jgi:deoxycytidylate deaminase